MYTRKKRKKNKKKEGGGERGKKIPTKKKPQKAQRGEKRNGENVKGKTRDESAQTYVISQYTAQKLIRKAKEQCEEEEGAKISPQKKTAKKPITQLKKIETQLEKLEFEGTEEEQEIKKKLIELLMK